MMRSTIRFLEKEQRLVRRRNWATSLSKSTAANTTTTHNRYLSTSSSKGTSLYTWGTNKQGTLLQGAAAGKVESPKLVADWKAELGLASDEDVSIAKMVCGNTDMGVLLSDGRCFVAGANKNGQLGLGHQNPVAKPTELVLPPGEDGQPPKVQTLKLGNNFSAIIDTNGDLYTFGLGGTFVDGIGFLGHGNDENYFQPTLVVSMVEDGCFAKEVHVGDSHLAVLTTEGEVLTCGAGAYGRLGNLETHEDSLFLEPVELLQTGVETIIGGKSFTMALKNDGMLYGWGRNHMGQLGSGLGLAVDMYAMQSVPAPIEADELLGRKIIQVDAGRSHAACITESGELFYWGMRQHFEPVRVDSLLHTKVLQIACGQDYTLALCDDGGLYSFGKSSAGALGVPATNVLNQAQKIPGLADVKVTSISAGWTHAACLTEDNNQ